MCGYVGFAAVPTCNERASSLTLAAYCEHCFSVNQSSCSPSRPCVLAGICNTGAGSDYHSDENQRGHTSVCYAAAFSSLFHIISRSATCFVCVLCIAECIGSSVLWLRRLALPPPKIAAARRVCSCPTLANSLTIVVLHFVWLRLVNLWVPSFGECSMVVRKVRACILSSISLRCWCQLVGYSAIWSLLWLTVQTVQYLHLCQKFVIEICSSFRLLVLDMASMVSR